MTYEEALERQSRYYDRQMYFTVRQDEQELYFYLVPSDKNSVEIEMMGRCAGRILKSTAPDNVIPFRKK